MTKDTAIIDTESGIKHDDMDLTVNPGADFYMYAVGNWKAKNPIPADRASWGTFYQLADSNTAVLRSIMERLAGDGAATAEEQKIGKFYATGMNEELAEWLGLTPVQTWLKDIGNVSSPFELAMVLADLHMIGIDAFFAFGPQPDLKNSTMNVATMQQAGLGLPERGYYIGEDENNKKLRQAYQSHVASTFELLGYEDSEAQSAAEDVLFVETALARGSMPLEEIRDASKQYNPTTRSDFVDAFPSMYFSIYFDLLPECPDFETLNVAQPYFFKALDELVVQEPMEAIRHYLQWRFISNVSPFLSSAFVKEKFNFYGKVLTGSKELRPRWKRVVEATNGALGEAVGKIYVRDYFPPEAKTRMLTLVSNLKGALRETIENLSWMGDQTRGLALAKLEAFTAKIGYPDSWRDYGDLEVADDAYVSNALRANFFEFQRQIRQIGQPVDRSEWHMSPQTVNAYYNPTENEIVFPAAILQPPFFDLSADDATNYGAIGFVIGHEMTHGFDDCGSQFDADGNMSNWWTEEDAKKFAQRVAKIVAQYSGYTVADGTLHLNGEAVAGEAAADLGGLKLAYKAFKQTAQGQSTAGDSRGLSPDQRFFIAAAQAFAVNSTPEYEAHQVRSDFHPPAQFRVNGTVANVPEFACAFGLTPESSPLLLPEERRLDLW